jgi:hypothetical protein
VVSALLLIGSASAREEVPAAQAPPECDVLIVWCGGVPDAPPLPGPEAGAVDAVTQATAGSGNIRQTAEALGKELEAAGRSVTILSAEDCRDPRFIIRAKALVLGCPDYFGLPPWQMVRFIDETLFRLYRARVSLNDHVVTSFATTARCQGVLRGIVQSTRGKAVDGAVVTPRGTSEADRQATVKELAERISDAL